MADNGEKLPTTRRACSHALSLLMAGTTDIVIARSERRGNLREVRCGKQLPTAGCGHPALRILSVVHSVSSFPEIATSVALLLPSSR